jgi:hypothetical protein
MLDRNVVEQFRLATYHARLHDQLGGDARRPQLVDLLGKFRLQLRLDGMRPRVRDDDPRPITVRQFGCDGDCPSRA